MPMEEYETVRGMPQKGGFGEIFIVRKKKDAPKGPSVRPSVLCAVSCGLCAVGRGRCPVGCVLWAVSCVLCPVCCVLRAVGCVL
jgi:hypothetical protein